MEAGGVLPLAGRRGSRQRGTPAWAVPAADSNVTPKVFVAAFSCKGHGVYPS